MSRSLVIASVVALLMLSSSSVANPGGNGDSDRDYTCGGSCHGDPSMSLPSDGTISISQDGDVFAGHAVAIHVNVAGMSLSDNRLLGTFILGSIDGNDDHPEDHGWHVIQDPNGGSSNYVETVVPSSGSVTLTWGLLAPEEAGVHNLFAQIHHGSEPNYDGMAYTGVSRGYSIDVSPVPEGLPGLSPDWTAPAYRASGNGDPLEIHTVNSTSLSVQWMLEGEWSPHDAVVSSNCEDSEVCNQWEAQIPATMGDTRIQYQITVLNGSFSMELPWLTMGTGSAPFEGDIWDARLQSFAFALLILSFIVSIQIRLSPWDGKDELDHTQEVVASEPEIPPPPPGMEEDPQNDDEEYWSRLVHSEENPGWLWDPVEEEWVADPNFQGGEQ